MLEWLKRHAWKACIRQKRITGSNPVLSGWRRQIFVLSSFFISLSELLFVGFMSFFRVLLAIIFPPLSILDRGCGSVLIVFLLTLAGWVPGVIAALVILNRPNDVQ